VNTPHQRMTNSLDAHLRRLDPVGGGLEDLSDEIAALDERVRRAHRHHFRATVPDRQYLRDQINEAMVWYEELGRTLERLQRTL
jgi:hypothetical protein